MPNQPRPDNPHHAVRVEVVLWQAAMEKAREEGTTISAVIRDALREFVRRTPR